MRARTRLLVAAAVVMAVAAVALLVWVRGRPGKPVPAPVRSPAPVVDVLRLSSVPVESRDLRLEARDLRVQSDRSKLEWSFTLVCHQLDGCRGESRIIVHYVSRGKAESLEADRALDLADGGELVIGRTLRQVQAVDRVERVTVQLLGRTNPRGPRPTPIG